LCSQLQCEVATQHAVEVTPFGRSDVATCHQYCIRNITARTSTPLNWVLCIIVMPVNNQQIVERYMAACTAADVNELLLLLAEDAVHYFSPREMKPIRGAAQIARLWLDARSLKPRWSIDNSIAQDDQVVVEFTNTFLDPKNQTTTRLNRGCEWYRLEDRKIVEIRAYFESDYSRDAGLTEYPYTKMGYTTKGTDA
jgi:ketosteroid isomerase-like protein